MIDYCPVCGEAEAVINRDGREIRFDLGSVSHGTMRDEDLLESFLEWLESVDYKEFRMWMEDNTDEDGRIVWDEWTVPELFDLLDSYAPEGYYFGAHPGDGSDYGFWECEED